MGRRARDREAAAQMAAALERNTAAQLRTADGIDRLSTDMRSFATEVRGALAELDTRVSRLENGRLTRVISSA